MPKVIKVRLSHDSISNAIKELNKRKKVIKKKTKELAKRLAKLGQAVAQSNYGSDISVSVKNQGNMFVINANGEDVCFLEFGAGTGTNTGHPYKDKMPFDVAPGSWSVQDKQQFYTWGYWYYGFKKMESVEPTNAMYKATVEIQNKVYKIAKEVFGND